jgi:D-methionine transport system ATP-binding protein
MSVIREICNTVAVIDNSNIVETGRIIELISNPKSEAAKKLFGDFIPRESLHRDFNTSGSQYSKRVLIKFSGDDALKPVISAMILEFGVYANILSGNIDMVQDTLIGEMLLDISGGADAVEGALYYLKDRKLLLEELKT